MYNGKMCFKDFANLEILKEKIEKLKNLDIFKNSLNEIEIKPEEKKTEENKPEEINQIDNKTNITKILKEQKDQEFQLLEINQSNTEVNIKLIPDQKIITS